LVVADEVVVGAVDVVVGGTAVDEDGVTGGEVCATMNGNWTVRRSKTDPRRRNDGIMKGKE